MTQELRNVMRELQLLEILPETERTEQFDAVVYPLVRDFAEGVRPEDPESVSEWLQIQSFALDWAVEGISEYTFEWRRREPAALERAVSLLPPEQQVRVELLLGEFRGEESLPRAVVDRDEAARERFRSDAEGVLRDAPAAETSIFGTFVGSGTFTSSRGFPVVRGTLTLLTGDGAEAGRFEANNGGGAPNHRMRNGPLPPGIYRVSNHRANRTTPGMVHEGVGYSFDLDPADGTPVFGRSLFRIHPDANPVGTNGCIGVREGAVRLRECEGSVLTLLRRLGAFKIAVSY